MKGLDAGRRARRAVQKLLPRPQPESAAAALVATEKVAAAAALATAPPFPLALPATAAAADMGPADMGPGSSSRASFHRAAWEAQRRGAAAVSAVPQSTATARGGGGARAGGALNEGAAALAPIPPTPMPLRAVRVALSWGPPLSSPPAAAATMPDHLAAIQGEFWGDRARVLASAAERLGTLATRADGALALPSEGKGKGKAKRSSEGNRFNSCGGGGSGVGGTGGGGAAAGAGAAGAGGGGGGGDGGGGGGRGGELSLFEWVAEALDKAAAAAGGVARGSQAAPFSACEAAWNAAWPDGCGGSRFGSGSSSSSIVNTGGGVGGGGSAAAVADVGWFGCLSTLKRELLSYLQGLRKGRAAVVAACLKLPTRPTKHLTEKNLNCYRCGRLVFAKNCLQLQRGEGCPGIRSKRATLCFLFFYSTGHRCRADWERTGAECYLCALKDLVSG